MANENGGSMPLILASGSPRRRELLAKMGYTFEICTPDVDEHVPGHARDIVYTLAERKAKAATNSAAMTEAEAGAARKKRRHPICRKKNNCRPKIGVMRW